MRRQSETGRTSSWAAVAALALLVAGPQRTFAQEAAEAPTAISVAIRDHRFQPSEIHVPAGKPAVLDISNEDPTAEEFDSSALAIEKVIAGGRKGIVRLHPLEPGRYPFMGEFHPDTAQGVVVAE